MNYDAEMQEILSGAAGKTILLHTCCAPCASGCFEKLLPTLKITYYFYNPNIDTVEEYEKRGRELVEFAERTQSGKVILENYDAETFLTMARGLEQEPERGARCGRCYRLRLEQTAKKAKAEGFDFFGTTLTLSPLKSADTLNEIGAELEEIYGIRYLCSDFKKRGGNLRSKAVCEEFGLYRQNYCGCIFSKR